jgi:lysophospholipase L1-like esterase
MQQHPIYAFFFIALAFAQCKHQPIAKEPLPEEPQPKEQYDMLCLGDSYTKGQGVALAGSFPYQLADSLRASGYDIVTGAPRVIAQTGWRTDQLQAAYDFAAEIKDSTFSLVTLLIGVNNQYQNSNFDLYAPQFERLLQIAIARAGNRPARVVVLSIPDYAYTPFGQNSSNPAAISAKLDQYNAANRQLADQYKVHYVDVTPTSRQGLARPELVATDQLHPSAIQYTEWVQLVLAAVR